MRVTFYKYILNMKRNNFIKNVLKMFKVTDFGNFLAMPGLVDSHVHVNE